MIKESIDSYGRTIDYLRISVTDRCNLRCIYCMPEEGIDKISHSQIMRNEEIVSFVKVAVTFGIKKIRITGGEPLVRTGLASLIAELKHIEGISEIGLTTNGLLLGKYAGELKEAGLDRINISLDTLDSEKYREITRGGCLNQVLEGIRLVSKLNFSTTKVNTVLIGGFNDDEIDRLMEFAYYNNLLWRLIELMPIGQVSQWSAERFISGQKLLDSHPLLEKEEGYLNSKEKQYFHKKYGIRVGLINSLSDKFCFNCNRIRLTSDGRIKPCLHSNIEYDVRPHLQDENALRKFYHDCLVNKPKEHTMEESGYQPVMRDMNKIGG